MTNKNYWVKRQKQWIKNQDKTDDVFARSLENQYKKTARELENEIAGYFNRYGKDEVLEYRTMLQDLSKKDKDLLYQDLEAFAKKYPDYEHLMPVRESVYKLNRMQGLHYSTELKLLELGAIEQEEFEKHLLKTYGNNYEALMSELGMGGTFNAMNDEIAKNTIFTKWIDDKNFSDRIWTNKEKLMSQLKNEYRDSLVRGDNYDKITDMIVKRLDVGAYDAKRLVWTESSFILNQSHTRPYLDTSVEEYELNAIMDNKTSDICRELDGERFRFNEIKVGVNFPPFHPWCRTTFIGLAEGISEDTEAKSEVKEFGFPEDVQKWIGNYDKEWIGIISEDELEAVRYYTSSGYATANRQLRGQDKTNSEGLKLISNLDKAISEFELKDNIKVYRNISRDALPYRDYDIMNLVGKEYTDKGFMSASVLESGAFSRHDIMLEMTVTKGKGNGAYINELSSFKDVEYEFLIKRDAKFKIKEIQSGRMTTIRMEMINDG